jgi:hypothetical protein
MTFPDFSTRPPNPRKFDQALYFSSGQPVRQCAVRGLTKTGVMLKIEEQLTEGTQVELAFFQHLSLNLVKMVRRSASVVHAGENGLVVLFFVRRPVSTSTTRNAR